MEVARNGDESKCPPNLDQCLVTLRERETSLRSRGILHIGIFGSIARREEREDSDVDVAISVDHKLFHGSIGLYYLEEDLAEVFGRKVDVISMGGLKVPKHNGILEDLVLAF